MAQPKVLVTAAAGKTGGATARALLAAGVPVRALVRRRDARAVALEEAGAEVVTGSLEDYADLQAAMGGVQRAYFCPPLEPGHLRRAVLFAAAAKAARLEAVVQLSQWVNDPYHPAAHAREKWLTNQVMAQSGLGVVTVEPGFFADNYFAALGPAAQFGLLAMPLGQGLNAPPSNEDIARVIAACLRDPGPHIGKAYRPTGPRLLTPEEIAAILGRALGRPVRYQDAPLPLFLKVARTLRLSDFVIGQLYWFLQDYQAGAFGLGAPTDAVQAVAHVEPESFETIAARYVRNSPLAHRDLGGWFREAAGLLGALLTPQPRIDRIEARYGSPAPRHWRLAMESDDWRARREALSAAAARVA
jgi:uncharacterized protein YbjT (DUF2867 family)